ncbi:chemotaxis protein CheW [Roseomonas sp. KE2513]|uniref:chemotaxis protein CheW n=1 Tax=Roseomonas sp. KE2513 TaxID=2479202 RepID=UPI0018E05B00|nr:chemotaxis protein CheW [Roseomonas sp. KE2513]MBI0535832.1 chemotaxis protein CheW [Roseomonas sp. KE2513]
MTPPSAAGLVLFATGGAVCALPRECVRALLPLPRLDAPPGLPEPLAGFLNLGGTAVPVVELARLLDVPQGQPHPYRHLILLNEDAGSGSDPLALLVDRVLDVLPPGAPLRPVVPESSLNGLIIGNLEVGDLTASLLDTDRLLLAEEAAVLGALTAQARARLARWAVPGTESSPTSGT